MARKAATLLGPDDPAPFVIDNAEGRSPFLLIGDHAGSAIPAALGDLGLSAADRARHIALDIGVRGLGREVARLLDAPFIHQPYSRLVIDCNRDTAREDAIPIMSDGSRVASNEGLDDLGRAARIGDIHRPYHKAISTEINRRRAEKRETIILALHSFTPVLDGFSRPWDAGVLYWMGRTEFAQAMLCALQSDGSTCVGDNQPYQMDATDYTVPFHAFTRRLLYAELEIRQDRIADIEGQIYWARKIQRATNAFLVS